jgi:GrpB-like predicted nucleotidyltransferase (UPF0157 family)
MRIVPYDAAWPTRAAGELRRLADALGAPGSEHERRHLAVRDYLREHEIEASRYAAIKLELGIRHPQDRLAYMAGKDSYLAELEARALSWAAGARS